MQIAEGAARWASALREHGVRPDDRVIVLAGSGLDWLEVDPRCHEGRRRSRSRAPRRCRPRRSRFASRRPRPRSSSPSTRPSRRSSRCRSRPTSTTSTRDRSGSRTHRKTRRRTTRRRAISPSSSRPPPATPPRPASGRQRRASRTRMDPSSRRASPPSTGSTPGRGDAVWCTAPTRTRRTPSGARSSGPGRAAPRSCSTTASSIPLERLDLLYRLGPTILCQSPAEYRALAGLRELERFRSPRLRRLVSTGDYLDPRSSRPSRSAGA